MGSALGHMGLGLSLPVVLGMVVGLMGAEGSLSPYVWTAERASHSACPSTQRAWVCLWAWGSLSVCRGAAGAGVKTRPLERQGLWAELGLHGPPRATLWFPGPLEWAGGMGVGERMVDRA